MHIHLSYLVGMLWEEAGYDKNISSVGKNIIDNLGSDLLVGMLQSDTITPIDFLEADVAPCDGLLAKAYARTAAEIEICERDPTSLTNSNVVIAYTNGSLAWTALPFPPTQEKIFPAVLAESIPNYLQALSAVIRMDIGKWGNNSIFADPNMFNASIAPNDAISDVLRKNQAFIPMAMPNELAVAGASLLRADPSQFLVAVEDRTPAIIAVNYSCHDYRRKSAFRLIVCKFFCSSRVKPLLNHCCTAVIVADFSMFSAFWTIFTAVASYFASTRSLKSVQTDYSEAV
jgi:hypothetical protein